MHRSEHHRPRSRALLKVFCKDPIGLFGIIQILVPALFGECMGIKPLQKLQIHSQPPEGILGRMDMQICHPGDYQHILIICNRQIPIFFGQHRVHPLGKSLTADQISLICHG